jgi:perosamine synthetase
MRHILPPLPILSWAFLTGLRKSALPCVLNSPNSVLTTSGRAAILLALEQLHIGRGDQVLLPTYHCPTMVSPAQQLGAEPLFFPITVLGEPDLEWLVAQDLSRVRAMVAAHYFGMPKRMGAIRAFCDKHGIALIEDCAHSLFGIADGEPVGSWGDFAIGSLTKFLPVPDGGCLTSYRRKLSGLHLGGRGVRSELRGLSNTIESGAFYGGFKGLNSILRLLFRFKGQLRSRPEISTEPNVREDGSAYRAAHIDNKLAHRRPLMISRWFAARAKRDRIVLNRRANYLALLAHFKNVHGCHPLIADLPEYAAPYVFPLWVDDPETKYQQLRLAKVPLYRWDWLWPNTPTYAGDLGIVWSRHVFQLPCHQDLTPTQIAALATTIKQTCHSG